MPTGPIGMFNDIYVKNYINYLWHKNPEGFVRAGPVFHATGCYGNIGCALGGIISGVLTVMAWTPWGAAALGIYAVSTAAIGAVATIGFSSGAIADAAGENNMGGDFVIDGDDDTDASSSSPYALRTLIDGDDDTDASSSSPYALRTYQDIGPIEFFLGRQLSNNRTIYDNIWPATQPTPYNCEPRNANCDWPPPSRQTRSI